MSSSSSSSDFSAEQLAAARNTAWHQDGRSLVTIESARNWVDHYGFVLFAPRAAQLGAPAPSFVESTLGAANESPTAAESATARSLVARLSAEGSVVPLNLLGTSGDAPDFLASAKVFPYVFTMRGDKGWKQPPQTTGANKVSPLALRVFEVLTEKGAMSAAELASELGREVTETAISRALGELWMQLRVIPQLAVDEGAATMWELLSARFGKAVKAGANAGQPSAMSALLSLYLAQAVAATEDEAAGFLSPLTARSRVREVVNALKQGRQLEETVVDGRQLLHVSGNLPAFAEAPSAAAAEGEAVAEGEASAIPAPKKVGTGRIGKFASDSKPREDYMGKPAKGFEKREPRAAGTEKAGPARKYGTGKERAYSPRPDTNRRPFTRSADAKPSFAKPWDEEKRSTRAEGDGAGASAAPRERKAFGDKPRFAPRTDGAKKAFGDRKPFTPRASGGEERPRKSFGDKPAFGERKSFGGGKSFGAAKSFGDRKPYTPREGGGEDRPRRTFGDKPSYGGAGGSGARKPYTPREGGGEDRPRRTFGDKPSYGGAGGSGARKPYTPRESGGEDRPRRTFNDKPSYGGAGGAGARKPYTPREGGGEDRPRRTFGDKPSYGGAGGSGARKPYTPREGGGERKPFAPREAGGGAGRPAFGSKPSFGSRGPSKFGAGKPGAGGAKFGAKRAGGSARPFTKRPASGGGATPRKRDGGE